MQQQLGSPASLVVVVLGDGGRMRLGAGDCGRSNRLCSSWWLLFWQHSCLFFVTPYAHAVSLYVLEAACAYACMLGCKHECMFESRESYLPQRAGQQ